MTRITHDTAISTTSVCCSCSCSHSTPPTQSARQNKVRSHLPPHLLRRGALHSVPPSILSATSLLSSFPSAGRSFHPRSPRCFSLTLSRRRRRRQRRRPCLQCPTTNSGHRREWPPLRRRRRRRRRRRPLPSSSSCRLSVTRRCRLNCRFPSKKSLPLLLALTQGAAVTFTSPTLE